MATASATPSITILAIHPDVVPWRRPTTGVIAAGSRVGAREPPDAVEPSVID
jgi:hypothetical protein